MSETSRVSRVFQRIGIGIQLMAAKLAPVKLRLERSVGAVVRRFHNGKVALACNTRFFFAILTTGLHSCTDISSRRIYGYYTRRPRYTDCTG